MHHLHPFACLVLVAALGAAEPAWLAPRPGLELHVAVDGRDAANGRAERPTEAAGPFATLERARDEIRALKAAGLPPGGITIWVQPGTYEPARTLELDQRDAGTAASPIVWRAKAGVVRLAASRTLPPLAPVTDAAVLAKLDPAAKGRVLQADLKALGITEYGEMGGGFGKNGLPGLEVFADDMPLHPSRYPNQGFMTVAKVHGTSPVDVRGTKGCKEGILTLADERMLRWTDEKDALLHGYWFWDWADQRQPIASIDAAQKIITLKAPWHSYGYRARQYCYAFNLLSEIDEAGEWYLDRSIGMLYVWPPGGARRFTVSVLPAVITAKDLAFTAFRGFTIEGARTHGMTLAKSSDCAVLACTIRNHGSWALRVDGGNRVAVIGCDITGTGDGGITLEGGDRKTLTPSGHLAENNHIHHYARWNRVYRPGVSMNGVGNVVRRNLFHHTPHQAIAFGGNDQIIELNEMHNVCEETNDAGVIYAWNDWAGRGNHIRDNFIHHVYGHEGKGCMGIYLDDNFSSGIITGNLMIAVNRALWLGGGRDHVVENNCFVDCKPAVGIDARGLNWRAYGKDELTKKLKAMPYTQEPWKSRYPQLLTLLDDQPMAPKGVVVRRNIGWGGKFDGADKASKPFVAFSDNLVDVDPLFIDAAKGDWRLRPDSPAFKLGFKALPIERMGLYQDALRASWPVVHPVEKVEPPPKPANQPKK